MKSRNYILYAEKNESVSDYTVPRLSTIGMLRDFCPLAQHVRQLVSEYFPDCEIDESSAPLADQIRSGSGMIRIALKNSADTEQILSRSLRLDEQYTRPVVPVPSLPVP